MKSVEVLKQLPALFRYHDVSKFAGNPNVFLTRALMSGSVVRISRSIYLNKLFHDSVRPEEVACYIKTPSYISCEWALNKHGVLGQVPTVCTAVTLAVTSGARDRIEYNGIRVEYSRIKPALFFGFEPAGGFNLATPEKALLDTIYLRGKAPFADELDLSSLRHDKATEFASHFPSTTRVRFEELFKS